MAIKSSRTRRRGGLVVAGLLALGGCPGKDAGPTEAAASPPPEGAAGADAEAKGEGEPTEAQGGGLASSVQQQVEAAKKEAPATAAAPTVAPGAALLAVVDGVPIPKSAFDEIYALKVEKYHDRGRDIPESADRRYRKSIAERLVHQERVRRRVAELGVDFDPADLAERQQQQRKGIRDWDKHLQRRGETEQSLRAMVVAELRERLILEAEGKLAVSRAEIESEYEKIRSNYDSDEPRIRAAHILVSYSPPPEGVTEAAARAEAKAEIERLHALATAPGADFGELAREHSTGPSASKGGDIGIFPADRMVEEFSKAAFALEPGEISEPIETKFGFHIIKSLGKWPPGELPIEALEDQIRTRLQKRKLHEGRRALKEELAAKYPATHHLLTPQELSAPAHRRERETKSEGETKR